VAQVLRCHHCSITLTNGAGEIVVDESAMSAPEPGARDLSPSGAGANGHSWSQSISVARDYGSQLGTSGSRSQISAPITLPDGTIGIMTAAGRRDGAAFSSDDQQVLDQLAAYYATSHATPERRETLRLKNDLRTLRKQAIQSDESERQRLAQELHDDVGHILTTAILSIDMKARYVPEDEATYDLIATAREALTECSDRLHEFAFQLRPRVLQDLGLAPALRSLSRRIRQAAAIEVTVNVHGRERRFGADSELAAFRVAQEALTNALKHARATRITVDITFDEGSLEVEVRDNGVGFTRRAAEARKGPYGQGLFGMRERAEFAGGVFELQSVRGKGTTVWARLPIGEAVHE
jgi:signal transduction histidine kinase